MLPSLRNEAPLFALAPDVSCADHHEREECEHDDGEQSHLKTPFLVLSAKLATVESELSRLIRELDAL